MDYEVDRNTCKTSQEQDNIEIEVEKNGTKKGRLFGNEKESIAYRHRIFHTACVCFSMFALVKCFYHKNYNLRTLLKSQKAFHAYFYLFPLASKS